MKPIQVARLHHITPAAAANMKLKDAGKCLNVFLPQTAEQILHMISSFIATVWKHVDVVFVLTHPAWVSLIMTYHQHRAS